MEKYFHSLLQLIGTMLGFEVISEFSTNRGRVDLVLKTTKYIYIFELKFNGTSDAALKQIVERKYYERFMHEKKNKLCW